MAPDAQESPPIVTGDDLQELMALVRALRLANGVTILFAQCEDADYRDVLIKQAQNLYGNWVAEVRVPTGTDRLLDYLKETIADFATVIFIVGIEDWLSAGVSGEASKFVKTLNSTRDRFSHIIHRPVVFWGPPHIFTTLLRGAPDFFSTVSAIFSFSREPERRRLQAKDAIPNYEAERRENELLALLAEHDSLPDSQQDESTRAALLLGIGKARRDAGRYQDAELSLQEAMEITERKFGLFHSETATAINQLGILYRIQNHLTEAEKLFNRALIIHERILTPDHPSIATTLNNLASLYELQGRYPEAESLYQRALKIYEHKLETNHPLTAANLNNLAGLYYEQGKYVDAEPLYRRTLEIHEQTLGASHPDTATSLSNLATVYLMQGRYAEVEPLYRRALEIRRQALGDGHPFTRESVHNLKELFRVQKRFKDMLPE